MVSIPSRARYLKPKTKSEHETDAYLCIILDILEQMQDEVGRTDRPALALRLTSTTEMSEGNGNVHKKNKRANANATATLTYLEKKGRTYHSSSWHTQCIHYLGDWF